MSSKKHILNKLRQAQSTVSAVSPDAGHRKMINLPDKSPDALTARFIEEAEKLGCVIHLAEDESDALQKLLTILETTDAVLAWEDEHLPFPIQSALSDRNIQVAPHDDSQASAGITGVDSALAATGSLILSSGQGKFRSASLLPDTHIALMKVSQIVEDLESWIELQRTSGLDAFKQSSNTVIISGPSSTGDIAGELIKGAHGPGQLHIILSE